MQVGQRLRLRNAAMVMYPFGTVIKVYADGFRVAFDGHQRDSIGRKLGGRFTYPNSSIGFFEVLA